MWGGGKIDEGVREMREDGEVGGITTYCIHVRSHQRTNFAVIKKKCLEAYCHFCEKEIET